MIRATLVCFAVTQEAKPFQRTAQNRNDLRVVITGMGAVNAERSVREAIHLHRAAHVFTCGFAGALDPDLTVGDVVCATEYPHTRERLLRAGARLARFHCATRIAVTAQEKRVLRESTGADAVEMESGVIATACRELGVPCTTVRVISDAADKDLPLDFNRVLDVRHNISATKLAFAVLQRPAALPGLMQLGRNTARAATRLAQVLNSVLRPESEFDLANLESQDRKK
jgi:adenosylhomocysteine nucleosidase